VRADARHNHDLLLEVAAKAFANEGPGASLKQIAADTGVGIGTLYRRFPTREALFIAVHRLEITRMAERADELLADHAPIDALLAWLEEFAAFLQAKEGMAEMFRSVMAGDENPFLDLRALTNDAAKRLIAAATGTGIRDDIDPMDILTAVHGLTLAATDSNQLRRLVHLILDGLRR